RVRHSLRNPALHALGVGDEQVVAHQLQRSAQLVGQELPAVPVVLGKPVLDGDDGKIANPAGIQLYQLGTLELFPIERVGAVVEELVGGGIDRQRDVAAQFVAGLADRLGDRLQRLA